jgi:hypothetical protein
MQLTTRSVSPACRLHVSLGPEPQVSHFVQMNPGYQIDRERPHCAPLASICSGSLSESRIRAQNQVQNYTTGNVNRSKPAVCAATPPCHAMQCRSVAQTPSPPLTSESADGFRYGQTDRQTDRQIERDSRTWIDGQIDRQTPPHTAPLG